MRSQGVHGTGSRTFTPDQLRLVVAVFQRLAPGQSLTVDDVRAATGVKGRTIRQIVTERDGLDFLLGGSDATGYTVAADWADAERKTLRMLSQVKVMQERIARRQQLTKEQFGDRLL